MSVVVAIKTKDGVVLGGDKQGTLNGMKTDNITKIFKSQYSNTAWGGVGKCRFLQILSYNMDDLMSYKDILDKMTLNEHYVIMKILPKIQDILTNAGELAPKSAFDLCDNAMLIVDSNNIFHIGNDGSVVNYNKFLAIGCGSDLATGYLENAWHKDLTFEQGEELVNNAIINSCKNDIFINDKIDIIKLKGESSNGRKK